MLGGAQQRGAVTLVGALFLLITVALMVSVLHRTTGGDMLNTVSQSDAVEALFVAETGIEHASFVYGNNGGNCAGLAGIGVTNAGRGSFDVTSAIPLAGTDCRIIVEATVSSAGAAAASPAKRTVSADLRLSSHLGWAVGDNGTMLSWNGSAWTAVASNTTENLYGVHCVSSNDCWATGDNGAVIRWNGTSWSPVASGTTGQLLDVSCPPLTPSPCYAVGALAPVAGIPFASSRQWNGTAWNVFGTLHVFDTFSFYNDVTCPASNCFTAMSNGRVVQSSTSWGSVFIGATPLNGIDCAAPDQCWAVGNLASNSLYFVRNNGGTWSSQQLGVNGQYRVDLLAVSCSAVDDCWAVGERRGNRFVFVHWNGSNWSPTALGDSLHREQLNGIHCVASNQCWAVGNTMNGWTIVNYDGSAWTYTGSAEPNPVNLHDVFILSGAGGGAGAGSGSVILVRWEELIN